MFIPLNPPPVQGSRLAILPSAVRDHAVWPDSGAARRPEKVLPAHRPRLSYRGAAQRAQSRRRRARPWGPGRGPGGGRRPVTLRRSPPLTVPWLNTWLELADQFSATTNSTPLNLSPHTNIHTRTHGTVLTQWRCLVQVVAMHPLVKKKQTTKELLIASQTRSEGIKFTAMRDSHCILKKKTAKSEWFNKQDDI